MVRSGFGEIMTGKPKLGFPVSFFLMNIVVSGWHVLQRVCEGGVGVKEVFMSRWMLALVASLWVFATTLPSLSYQEAPITVSYTHLTLPTSDQV